MMAASAGANSVVACEIHPTLAEMSRVVIASNNLNEKISVINRDACMLERGKGKLYLVHYVQYSFLLPFIPISSFCTIANFYILSTSNIILL